MAYDARVVVVDDFALLDAWRAGDRVAGNTLFERHFESVSRFFKNKVDGGVEDLVQETFLACVESKASFEGRAKFRTFLLGIARNKLLMYYRRKRGDRTSALDVSVADMGCRSGSWGSWLARDQEQRLMLAALRRLPLETQMLLELYYWEELSGPELGEAMDLPHNTVRSRLSRARVALRAKVEEPADNPELAAPTPARLARAGAAPPSRG